jgi:PAS domain S-box-containing protein
MEEAYRRLESRLHDLDRELEAKNRELALTGDYLNSILEGMSDGVIAINTDGIVTTYNHAAARVLGFDPAAVVGRAFTDVFRRDFAAPPRLHPMEWHSHDGTAVLVSECDSPLCDRDNRRIGAVKVFQDITEIEALRSRVRQKDRLAAVGEMAATVAHEIRNPLGGIRGFAALLARDIPAGDPRARLVEKIEVGAKELERLVNELLEFTRPLQVKPRPILCAELVDSALAYVDVGGYPITLVNEADRDARVIADPDKMRQALLNILLNAVQSIDRTGAVRVFTQSDSTSVTIAVADTGCGMTSEQVEQAFSPFFTTKEKGTGLGLAVAAKVVEGHGGSMSIESEAGKGSTFYVRLPRAE